MPPPPSPTTSKPSLVGGLTKASSKPKLASRMYELEVLAVKLCLCAFNIAGLVTAIAAAEYVYAARSDDNPLGKTPQTEGVKLATTIFTLLSIGCYCVLYALRWRSLHVQGRVLPGQRFTDTALLPAMLYDCALVALHCPVGCYSNLNVLNYAGIHSVYDADSLISVLMFGRLMPLFNLLVTTLSRFNAPGASLVGAQTGVHLNTNLALRYTLQRWTVATTVIMYGVCVSVLAYALRVMERDVCHSPETLTLDRAGLCSVLKTESGEEVSKMPKSLEYMINCYWCILITSLTVGYGDMYPGTILGRAVSVVAALMGLVVIAMLVNAVNSLLKMDAEEEMAMRFLRRGPMRLSRLRLASRVVNQFMHYAVARLRAGRKATEGGAVAGGVAATAGGAAQARHWLTAGSADAVPHTVLRALFFALEAWRAHLYSWRMQKRKADTVEVVAANCAHIMVRARSSPPFRSPPGLPCPTAFSAAAHQPHAPAPTPPTPPPPRTGPVRGPQGHCGGAAEAGGCLHGGALAQGAGGGVAAAADRSRHCGQPHHQPQPGQQGSIVMGGYGVDVKNRL